MLIRGLKHQLQVIHQWRIPYQFRLISLVLTTESHKQKPINGELDSVSMTPKLSFTFIFLSFPFF